MGTWRTTEIGTVTHPDDGEDFTLSPELEYDDKDRRFKGVLRRWPSFFYEDSPVERATAAPGEKRTVRKRA